LDSLTHIVLGACIGEVVAGKNFGKKAMIGGALAQSIPDLDFIEQLWLDKPDDLLAHRGFTHSILFAVLATVVLSIIFIKFFHKEPISWKRWPLLFGLNIFTHIFIDSFNAYGVGWFEPFYDQRISFHLLFVADPLFSIWPFIGFILIFIFRDNRKRRIACVASIAVAFTYVLYAIFNKVSVEKDVKQSLASQGISSKDYITTPTPFNSFLWLIIAKDTNGYLVGYRSVFDKQKEISFQYYPQNNSLLNEVNDKQEISSLSRFASGYYTVEKWNDTLVFNVLRFGQVASGLDSSKRFAFHYFLDRPGENELVVQRGRFKNWNSRTIHNFIDRIKGN
jgi:inner membrane protein